MRNYAHSGFTLIELLVAIGVAAVILGIAVPSFTSAIANSRMTGSVNDVLSGIVLARSEAIKRRVPVTICRSEDSTSADPACDTAGGGWHEGWIVFVDDNDADADGVPDGNGTRDGGEQVLRAGAGAATVTVDVLAASAPLDDFLTFNTSGFPRNPGAAAGRNMLFCDARASDFAGRVINISQTGRPQVRRVDEVGGLGMTCE